MLDMALRDWSVVGAGLVAVLAGVVDVVRARSVQRNVSYAKAALGAAAACLAVGAFLVQADSRILLTTPLLLALAIVILEAALWIAPSRQAAGVAVRRMFGSAAGRSRRRIAGERDAVRPSWN